MAWVKRATVTLASFLDDVETRPLQLRVVNRTEPAALERMLENAFENQPVEVSAGADDDAVADDLVYLLDDGEVVARSPLADIADAYLLGNSDLYVTGSRELADADLPDVLAGLTGVKFRLRGYPASNKEKFLLIAVSRLIERRAWLADGGTLRSSFQHLGRIGDEFGTERAYRQLAATDTSVHVYGVAGSSPPADLDVAVHTGTGPDYRDTWFVLFTPEPDRPADAPGPIGLLAAEVEDAVWEGFFTEDAERVAAMDDYVAVEL